LFIVQCSKEELPMEAKLKRGGRPAAPVVAIPSEPADPVENAAAPAESPVPAVREAKRTKQAPLDLGHAALAAWGESHTAAARGLDALNVEMAGLARAGIENAARTANRLLAVKTLSDAIEVAAGFARSTFETTLGGSAKLSELGVKMAAEVSTPFLEHFAKDWTKAGLSGG
jgi:hypothetical protein